MPSNILKPGAMTALALLPVLFGSAYAAASDAASKDAKALDDIVVTASPLAGDPDRFAAIVSQVDRDAILRNGGANLADSLADVPGVTGTNFAAGASRPVIRGMDANRVKILEDGVGSFDVSDIGPDHGVPIDPLAAQSVEVVRGAATLRYGSQAIGGVVNAINNRVPSTLPDQDFSGDITGSYGTGADARQGAALLDAKAGQFAFHGDGFYRKTNDYGIPGGTQPNSFFKGDGFSLGSSYFLDDDKSRVGGAVIHYDSKYGIPSDTTYINMKQTKGLFQSSLALGGVFKTLNIDAGYADYTHSEIESDTNETDSTFNNKEWDGRAEGLTGAFGPFSAGALGIQVQHRNFSALGEDSDYLFPTMTQSEAGFAFAESQLAADLHLQLAARVERVDVHGTPASNDRTERGFTPVSGSAGLLYDLSDVVKLGVTLSSAARAPAQTELFARGPHDGPGTFETGDPTLKIERANSLEGTLRVRSGIFHFDGSVWGAAFDNFIYGRLTGDTCDDDGTCGPDAGDLKQLVYGQHSARFWGGEGKGTATLLTTAKGGVLAAEVLADYVRATLHGAGNVPRIPPYHLGGGLTWESTLFDAGVLLKYAGRQDDLGFGETPTGGFYNLDANIAVRPFASNPRLELAVIGHNLTNATQRDAVSLNKDDVVLAGRDVRFEVRMQF